MAFVRPNDCAGRVSMGTELVSWFVAGPVTILGRALLWVRN